MSNLDSNLSQKSTRSHFAPFRESFGPWLVLVRNSMPVIGVYWFGWSADLIIFQIWFDGVTALGAMLAFQIRAFAQKGGKEFEAPAGVPVSILPLVLTLVWLALLLLLGIPYWFTIFFFSIGVFDDGLWGLIFHNFGIIALLLFVLTSNIVEESRHDYKQMNHKEIRLEFNWQFNMHLVRISAILLASFVLRLGLIIGLTLVLSYVEIYPMRALRFFGGDKTLEAGNEDRSRD